MRLLCSLGLHVPKGSVRWNHGYYFTKCARCGRDLVRTAHGRWHVPQGQRVVWQAGRNVANAATAVEPPLYALAGAGSAIGRSTAETVYLSAEPIWQEAGGVLLLVPSPGAQSEADIEILENQLGAMLGLKVRIRHGPAGGSVAIDYETFDQLDTICQRLSGQTI